MLNLVKKLGRFFFATGLFFGVLFILRPNYVFAQSNDCFCELVNSVCTLVRNECPSGTTPVCNTAIQYCNLTPDNPSSCYCTATPPGVWCGGNNGILTALGCLNISSPNAFISQLLPWAVGLAGLIALVSIVYAGFLITSAGGDPKKIAAGKEIIFTAITGLIVIALSVVLLNFVGVQILNLGLFGFHG